MLNMKNNKSIIRTIALVLVLVMAMALCLTGCSDATARSAAEAAQAAAADCGFDVKVYHHDEVGQGVTADLIIYTLPSAVEGIEKFRCNCLIEANYRNPSFCEGMVDGLNGEKAGYVSGKDWLLAQAQCGYELMTGEKLDDVFSLLEVFDA